LVPESNWSISVLIKEPKVVDQRLPTKVGEAGQGEPMFPGRINPRKMKQMMDKMGIKDVISAYGMTENSGISTCSRRGDPPEVVANTAGKLMFKGCDLKILDPETGKEVPRGTQGEICTKGWFVMKEYYKMPEETKKPRNDLPLSMNIKMMLEYKKEDKSKPSSPSFTRKVSLLLKVNP
jgi:acyl-CoA synthetase (AMP-forming)/AMP-acid ligase II